MKQIIPFKKELLFKTKVSEITSISLEHTLSLRDDDLISGEFHISGDYKMTDASINRETFSFVLPFDIALDSRYDTSSIVIDIDNFYYEIVNNESLQVNIDVYVEGEKLIEEETVVDNMGESEEGKSLVNEKISDDTTILDNETLVRSEEEVNEDGLDTFSANGSDKDAEMPEEATEEEFIPDIVVPDIIRENILESDDEKTDENIATNEEKATIINNSEDNSKIAIQKSDFNIFENIDNSDTYVTYHVYIVKENDNLEKIMEKYNASKEDIAIYNDISDIKPGMKLVIPNTNANTTNE